MKDLNVDELRAFLAGDDSCLASGDTIWGYFDGKILGNPPLRRNHSEIVDGRLVVQSHRDGRLAEYPLAELGGIAHLTVSRFLQHPSSHTWVVDQRGHPLAEVPWGAAVQGQAEEAGLRLRKPVRFVSKKAFQALRPERRLD